MSTTSTLKRHLLYSFSLRLVLLSFGSWRCDVGHHIWKNHNYSHINVIFLQGVGLLDGDQIFELEEILQWIGPPTLVFADPPVYVRISGLPNPRTCHWNFVVISLYAFDSHECWSPFPRSTANNKSDNDDSNSSHILHPYFHILGLSPDERLNEEPSYPIPDRSFSIGFWIVCSPGPPYGRVSFRFQIRSVIDSDLHVCWGSFSSGTCGYTPGENIWIRILFFLLLGL